MGTRTKKRATARASAGEMVDLATTAHAAAVRAAAQGVLRASDIASIASASPVQLAHRMRALEAATAALGAVVTSDPLLLLAREEARIAAMTSSAGGRAHRSVEPWIVKRVLGGDAAKKTARASRKKGARS